MGDCCKACRTPFICTNRHCICHALRVEKNLGGQLPYSDPTGREAMRNVSRREPKRKRSQR